MALDGARKQAFNNSHDVLLATKRLGVNRVVPVVVAWGPKAADLGAPGLGFIPPDESCIVIPGIHLTRWLASVAAGSLSREQVDAVYDVVAEHALRRDLREEPAPISVSEALLAVWRPFAAAYVSVLTAVPMSSLPALGDLAVALVSLSAALLLRRRSRWRLAGTAAATIQVLLLLVVALELASIA